MNPKATVRKATRTYKGRTLEIMPITDKDAGIVFNGPATIWFRQLGVLGSARWYPNFSEACAVRAFRKAVNNTIRLLASAKARA